MEVPASLLAPAIIFVPYQRFERIDREASKILHVRRTDVLGLPGDIELKDQPV